MFGSGGGRIVSPCPLAHSTSNGTSCWEKEAKLGRLSTLSMMMLRGRSAPSPPIHESPLCVHPQVGTGLSSFFMHRHLFCLISCSHDGSHLSVVIHVFDIVESGCFPFVFWGLVQVSLTHMLRVYIFFPSASCVSFFLLICFPGWTVVFSML